MSIGVSDQTWCILLVSASEHTRDEVGEALAGRGVDHQLLWVSQADWGVSRAQEATPEIVLVDTELAGSDPIALIEQLVSQVPRSAVVAMTESGEMAQASQAVLVGARGFVVKPVQPDDLLTTLTAVLSHSNHVTSGAEHRASQGKIVVFCAPKGGTGRTTVAINTALSLRMMTGQSVALVDADYPAPALDVALNLKSERSISDLLYRSSGLDEDLMAGVLVEHASGIRVLLAPSPTGDVTPMSVPQVQSILAVLQRMFAWVVVDLGLPHSESQAAFMDEADLIVISVLPEMVGVRNARMMLDQLRMRGHSDDRFWLVVNRATMGAGISADDIEETLHLPVKQSIPDDQPLATHSINLGVPLVIGYEKSAVALAMRDLAQDLITELSGDGASVQRRRDERQPAEDEAPKKSTGLRALLPGSLRIALGPRGG